MSVLRVETCSPRAHRKAWRSSRFSAAAAAAAAAGVVDGDDDAGSEQVVAVVVVAADIPVVSCTAAGPSRK